MEIRNSRYIHNSNRIYCEDSWKFNAPHHFTVESADGIKIGQVDFQEGPIKENGLNGISNEDLLIMVMTRLQAFQCSDYKCVENQEAIDAIDEALRSLNSRTTNRISRNAEGTSKV